MRDRISTNRLLFELGKAGVEKWEDTQKLMQKAILEGKFPFTSSSRDYIIAYNPADAGPECWELWQE